MTDARSTEPPLLEVEHLTVDVPGADGPVRIIDDVSFSMQAGTTTGLIGESGSGKTMTAMAVLGLLPPGSTTGGSIRFRGRDLLSMNEDERRKVRGREISMIFQDPLAALNPTQRIGKQVGEILRANGSSRAEAQRTAVALLDRAGIPDPAARADDYPHQFSGGMRQRAMVALALAGTPQLILADEPTTALDVTVQARILDLLRSLRDNEGTAMLLVSHDLRVMAHVADHLVVMYAGRVAERGPARELLRRPKHPYTRALVHSVPSVSAKSAIADPLPGAPANPRARPTGCAFHPRCPMARDICRDVDPALLEVGPGRRSACHFAEEVPA
ncbi:ABC transporter ATP-binding protein [Microbacterium sp. CFH 90308]|uniref:ABC transporter ATP-binding protein n=1 Tax=Microbacterium salsuginis TaxID=2722803 RepID=A0ABX1KFF4_9MICO|nr:ABC transporter ATP-binding protein [Microbacterium sp. CFH 90308]NLP85207.1 ABC transporter ATP-binding protein [Microbacterium sp. CFH 90308]